MARMTKKSNKGSATTDKIMEVLLDMDERMATKEDLKNFATKMDLEKMKDEILAPLMKAVDKDAETIINHGKRITVLERRAGMATK